MCKACTQTAGNEGEATAAHDHIADGANEDASYCCIPVIIPNSGIGSQV